MSATIPNLSELVASSVDLQNDLLYIVDVSVSTDSVQGSSRKIRVGNLAESIGIVNVKNYGATGDGVTDDTAAIQAAIDSGALHIIFPAGIYQCVGLTQSTNNQQFHGLGNAQLRKNGNGVIFTLSGDFVECHNLGFRGDSATPTFTGDNVNFSGDNCALVNCYSMHAYGRAVKATGGHFQITGTGKGGVYQTSDASVTGYDLEIGVSGTATLYHQLIGIYSSQVTGGIIFTDTGGHFLLASQFGKLTVSSGTSPAGVNGGFTIGNRIQGAITINISNSILSGSALGVNAHVTYGAGTANHAFGVDNSVPTGVTITNNGNDSSPIFKQISAASFPSIRCGDDAASSYVNFIQAPGVIALSALGVANSATASSLGTVTKKMQVYSEIGVSLGYVPIYDAIT